MACKEELNDALAGSSSESLDCKREESEKNTWPDVAKAEMKVDGPATEEAVGNNQKGENVTANQVEVTEPTEGSNQKGENVTANQVEVTEPTEGSNQKGENVAANHVEVTEPTEGSNQKATGDLALASLDLVNERLEYLKQLS